jgi:hypothetical protein
MQGITAYWPHGSVLIILTSCGLHFNHLFIWLDPEVVAHDELIATKSGYLNFPLIMRQLHFFDWLNYIDIILLKLPFMQDESNDDSFIRRILIFCRIFKVLYCNRVNYVGLIMSIDPHSV